MTKRIIPCLDIINERVVVGEQFKNLQDVEDPIALATYYEESQADDLIVYEISGKAGAKKQFLPLIQKISTIVSMPLTVGGGLNTIQDIESTLQAGADRVSLNSAALKNKQFLQEAIKSFGSEKIVLAIDAKEVTKGRWHAFFAGGKKDSGLDIFQWAKEAEQLGVSEIVLNAIDSDGAKNGYHLELNKQMTEHVSLPVIASGGAGLVEHFSEVFQQTKVAGALAATIFHRRQVTIQNVKQHLKEKNLI